MYFALFSWIISSLINCNILHLYALNQQVLPPEEEIWILNLTAKCPVSVHLCNVKPWWAPNTLPYKTPLSQKRMVSNKLGEARAFQTEGSKREVFSTNLPTVRPGQLQRLLIQILSWRQGVAGLGPGLPRMMISLSLIQQASFSREKNRITERHSFPGTCKSLEYYVNTCSHGYCS